MALVNYTDYEWAAQHDLSEYGGKWIAIVNEKVVAASNNISDARNKAKKVCPSAVPFLKKVPKEAISIL
ncbi:MAG: DUF5678 domain-containing protein [Candidatus Diapherotrites archaeon]|nr:succinyl-CoA synthetase subunit alpha [Candidatus Micrarchaeota archaeon]MBU1939517.1 succinyl-CoA synthetase subunit alpha [Candidatus Micrarchaeota archaeon]